MGGCGSGARGLLVSWAWMKGSWEWVITAFEMRFVKRSWRVVDWWRMEASFWEGAMGPRMCWRRERRDKRF